jgi:hypothetical protein
VQGLVEVLRLFSERLERPEIEDAVGRAERPAAAGASECRGVGGQRARAVGTGDEIEDRGGDQIAPRDLAIMT